MIFSAWATICVLGVLSAFLVSRCQRGIECRIFASFVVVFRSFALLSFSWTSFALVCVVLVRPGSLSYGVRHMHSSVPYCLSYLVAHVPMLSCALYFMLIVIILPPCLVLAILLQDMPCL